MGLRNNGGEDTLRGDVPLMSTVSSGTWALRAQAILVFHGITCGAALAAHYREITNQPAAPEK